MADTLPIRPDVAPSAPPATTPPAAKPLAVPAAEAARLCGIGRSTWDKLSSTEANPAPVRLGGAKRWLVADLEAWLAAGCPDRKAWEKLAERKRGGR